jgi:hypothetical protein
MIQAIIVIVFGLGSYFAGRLYQSIRDQKEHLEAYKTLLAVMRVSPDEAIKLLDSVLEKGDHRKT